MAVKHEGPVHAPERGFHVLESKRLVNCVHHKKGRCCYFLHGKYRCGKLSCHLYVTYIQRYDAKGEYRDDNI